MTEINISRFFAEAEPFQFSASAMEMGQDAGKITWANAVQEGTSSPLLTTEEELDALRQHVRGYGAWSEEEIAAWSDAECNALFIQLVSGDMREGDLEPGMTDADWEAFEARCSEGQCSGNIGRGIEPGTVYYTLDA